MWGEMKNVEILPDGGVIYSLPAGEHDILERIHRDPVEGAIPVEVDAVGDPGKAITFKSLIKSEFNDSKDGQIDWERVVARLHKWRIPKPELRLSQAGTRLTLRIKL